MRLERLNYNKIKIFLTLDELFERGLTKEDIWKDTLKWTQLFNEMLDEANEAFGVDINGPVAVEIFSIHAQEMVMIVTMEEGDEEDILDDGFMNMQGDIDGSKEHLIVIKEFEDVLHLARRLAQMNVMGGSLFVYHNQYYFYLFNKETNGLNNLFAILSEYGDRSLVSMHVLQEYGKEIIQDDTVRTLLQHFH